jgi:starch-binding outer membrane protein, SusD/RagB family
MKTYKFSLGLAAMLSLFTTSCELEETVYSQIYTEQFYQSAPDAEAAITAVYGSLAEMYAGPAPLMVADFSADQVYPRPVVGRNTFTLFNYDQNYTSQKSFNRENESPVQIWRSAYSGIEKANWVIDKVPATNMDAVRRTEIIGEAYFLRAFYHWMLTKTFGDVVLKTKPSKSEADAIVGKSTQPEIYVQIFAELEQAATNLPDYSATLVKGRASKQAALALHAKAALYAKNYPLALAKATQVISSGKSSLMPNVADVYRVTTEDAARVENLFAFESEGFAAPARFSQITSLYGPRNSDGPEYSRNSFGSIFAYPAFYASFNPIDKRRELLATSYVRAGGAVVMQANITPITPLGVLVKKYQDPVSAAPGTSCNIHILRYADVLLIAAEAEAQVNGATATAYGFINQVRTRAGIPDLTPGLSKDAFIDAVLQERSWELFAEGDRWYDLSRTDKFLTVIPLAVNDVFPVRTPLAKHKYFPIPQDEINANPKLEQNDPWK